MAVVLVLLACLGNALALTLQRKAAQDSARQRGRSAGSLRDMVRRPPWLFGTLVFGVAVICQNPRRCGWGRSRWSSRYWSWSCRSPCSSGKWILGGALRRYEWGAVATMSVGLVVLLACLRPHDGDALAAGNLRWILGTLVDPRRHGGRGGDREVLRGGRQGGVLRHRGRGRVRLRRGDHQGDDRRAGGRADSARSSRPGRATCSSPSGPSRSGRCSPACGRGGSWPRSPDSRSATRCSRSCGGPACSARRSPADSGSSAD